jgi:hypothetical protein
MLIFLLQAQTPQQRMSNQKFAKENTAKMGKPEGSTLKKKQQTFKSPVSPIWLGTSNHNAPTALQLLIRPLSSPFSIRGVRWSHIRVNFEDILQIIEADQGGGEIDTRGSATWLYPTKCATRTSSYTVYQTLYLRLNLTKELKIDALQVPYRCTQHTPCHI